MVNITGTLIGQDTNTQITTIVTGQTISLRRNVSESVQVDLNSVMDIPLS